MLRPAPTQPIQPDMILQVNIKAYSSLSSLLSNITAVKWESLLDYRQVKVGIGLNRFVGRW